MAESKSSISFEGFGPVGSPSPSFAQGIGRGGSFAPIWTVEPKMPSQFQPVRKILKPFDANISYASSGSIGFYFIPGTVQGVLPDNMFDYFSSSTSGQEYFYLECKFTQSSLTSCKIKFSSSAPSAQTIIESIPPQTLNIVFNIVNDGICYNLIQSPTIMLQSNLIYSTSSASYYGWTWK